MNIDTLTQVERKQLILQLQILQKLDPNEYDYEADIEVLRNGFSVEYGDLFSEVFEEMPIDECNYVCRVLDMHRALLQSYEDLPDKSGVEADSIAFRGFDGNNEPKRHSYSTFLSKQGKWAMLKGQLNSHSATTMTRYPRMLERWDGIKSEHGIDAAWNMTAEQINYVVSYPAPL